eukprot:2362042-Alexandrium_andersonii.AAC.1
MGAQELPSFIATLTWNDKLRRAQCLPESGQKRAFNTNNAWCMMARTACGTHRRSWEHAGCTRGTHGLARVRAAREEKKWEACGRKGSLFGGK